MSVISGYNSGVVRLKQSSSPISNKRIPELDAVAFGSYHRSKGSSIGKLGVLGGIGLFLVAAAGALLNRTPIKPAVTQATAPVIVTLHGQPDRVVAMVDDEPEFYKDVYGNHPDKISLSTDLLGQLSYNEWTGEYHALEADRETEQGDETVYYGDGYKLEEFAKGTREGVIVLPKADNFCNIGGQMLDSLLGADNNTYTQLEVGRIVKNNEKEALKNGDYTVYYVDKNGETLKDKPLFDIHVAEDKMTFSVNPSYLAGIAAIVGEIDKGFWAEGGITDLMGDGPFDLDPEDCYNTELWFKNQLSSVFGTQVGHETNKPYPFKASDKLR